jgi:hypothetical protein
MRRLKLAVVLVATMVTSGCSKTDVQRCVDDQMQAWEQRNEVYQQSLVDHPRPAPALAPATTPTANSNAYTGGLAPIDPDLLPDPLDPGPKAQAKANASLVCGRAYGAAR